MLSANNSFTFAVDKPRSFYPHRLECKASNPTMYAIAPTRRDWGRAWAVLTPSTPPRFHYWLLPKDDPALRENPRKLTVEEIRTADAHEPRADAGAMLSTPAHMTDGGAIGATAGNPEHHPKFKHKAQAQAQAQAQARPQPQHSCASAHSERAGTIVDCDGVELYTPGGGVQEAAYQGRAPARPNDPVEYLSNLREWLRTLPDTKSTFRAVDTEDVAELPISLTRVHPALLWMAGVWSVPEWFSAERHHRYVNPHASVTNRRYYADVHAECECGARIVAVNAQDAPDWHTGHDESCPAIDRQTAIVRLWHARRDWLLRGTWLGVSTETVGVRMNTSTRDIARQMRHVGLECTAVIESGRAIAGRTMARLSAHGHSQADIARAYGVGSSTVSRRIRAFGPDDPAAQLASEREHEPLDERESPGERESPDEYWSGAVIEWQS